jgi:hypothetical protein
LKFSFPVLQSNVTRPPRFVDIAPHAPGSAWDGWFSIAIMPPGSPIRWVKAHLFHRACRDGWHPVASFEGMDSTSEAVIAYGTANRVEVCRRDLQIDRLEVDREAKTIELPGRFRMKSVVPVTETFYGIEESSAEASFSFESDWPIWWSRWGRMLHYIGQPSKTAVELSIGNEKHSLNGFGMVEHVSGMSLPFDITQTLPVQFHWDVLSFNDPAYPTASAAGLSIGTNGNTRIELRAGAKLPGLPAQAVRGLNVRYIDLEHRRDHLNRDLPMPVRWEGRFGFFDGEFVYEAVAATPVAGLIRGGGMFGIEFEGEYKPRRGKIEKYSGTGFTEVGDFSDYFATALQSPSTVKNIAPATALG